jgi:hypothetical protein
MTSSEVENDSAGACGVGIGRSEGRRKGERMEGDTKTLRKAQLNTNYRRDKRC